MSCLRDFCTHVIYALAVRAECPALVALAARDRVDCMNDYVGDSGSGKEAASYTTYTADSDHESRASSVASAKHTPRAVKATPGAATLASSAVAQYTGAAKPAVTFGAPIAPADLSSHTEHYSEASVTPPRPA